MAVVQNAFSRSLMGYAPFTSTAKLYSLAVPLLENLALSIPLATNVESSIAFTLAESIDVIPFR